MEYKDFKIVSEGMLKRITNKGSGAMPQSLSGLYTNSREAMWAIDSYKPKRGAKKRDAEANTTA